MSLPKVYNHFKHPPSVGITCPEAENRTDESQAPDCDINRIMANYQKTGVWPAAKVAGQFLDVSDAVDFHTAMNTITYANELFYRLDASIRKEFDNDPAKLMEALHDPKQLKKCEELGLITLAGDPDPGAIGDALPQRGTSSAPGAVSESTAPKNSAKSEKAPKAEKASENT